MSEMMTRHNIHVDKATLKIWNITKPSGTGRPDKTRSMAAESMMDTFKAHADFSWMVTGQKVSWNEMSQLMGTNWKWTIIWKITHYTIKTNGPVLHMCDYSSYSSSCHPWVSSCNGWIHVWIPHTLHYTHTTHMASSVLMMTIKQMIFKLYAAWTCSTMSSLMGAQAGVQSLAMWLVQSLAMWLVVLLYTLPSHGTVITWLYCMRLSAITQVDIV